MYLSAHDIHAHFNGKVSLYTIRQYMATKKIRSRKIGGKWLTTWDELQNYINSCEAPETALETAEARISAPKLAKALPDFRQQSTKSILAQLSK